MLAAPALLVTGSLLQTPSPTELHASDVVIAVAPDGTITHVLPASSPKVAELRGLATETVDLGPHQRLLPGLVDLHIHAPQWPQLGTGLGQSKLPLPKRPGCSALCPGFAAGGMADELHVPSRGALRGLNLRPISLGRSSDGTAAARHHHRRLLLHHSRARHSAPSPNLRDEGATGFCGPLCDGSQGPCPRRVPGPLGR